MKYGFLAILLAVIGMTANTADANPEETLIVPQIMYVPQGFDNNDSTELFFEGYLPDTCYKRGPIRAATVTDSGKKEINIEIVAYNYFSTDADIRCLPIITEYSRSITVGLIKEPGEYDIYVKNPFGDKVHMGKLPIGVALTPTPDEHLYAPVKEVSIKMNSEMKVLLTMKGTFPNACMRFQNVRVIAPENPGEVMDVLPQVEVTDETCAQVMTPFEKTIELPELKRGRYLVHVRTMNGSAIFKPYNF